MESAAKAPQLIPFQFKGAAAKANSIKGIAARKANAANRKAGITVEAVESPAQAYERRELESMREEITRTRKQLAEESDADKRFKLGCLLKKDWEIYQLLAGMPGPGTRKPKAEPTKRQNQSSEPIED